MLLLKQPPDPTQTLTDHVWALSADSFPKSRCLGRRPYDPTTKTFGLYQWEDYETVRYRKTNIGWALVELHRGLGVVGKQYGVGVWCQNRPEWQLIGKFLHAIAYARR